MERIYDQAKDKNIAAIIIYGKASESTGAKAYVDAAGTIQFKTSELKDAFLKRALVQIGSDIFVPISYTESSNVGTVTYAKAGSSNAAAVGTLVAVAD